MLSVTSVNGYNPYFKANSDNEAKKVPMRAVSRRAQQPKDERSEYEKKVRRAQITRGITTGAGVLGSLALVAFLVMQIIDRKSINSLMGNGNGKNWKKHLNIISKEELAKHRGFDDMVQHPEIKTFWSEQLNAMKNEDFFSKVFGENGNAILLYGPAGTGKTEGAYALAKHFGDNAILNKIDCSSLKQPLNGASEGKIVNSLDAATELCKENPDKKIIVLLDEMSIANKDDSLNSELTKSMQDAFKDHLMPLLSQPNAIIIGTTNYATRGVPLDTLMNEAILSRFGTKKYFPSPSKEQFLDVFKKRMTQWEEIGAVESNFFEKNKTEFNTLAQEMESGEASFRTYWLGIEKKIKGIAGERYSKNNITGENRKIIMDDIEQAVYSCKKEENWGVKQENKDNNFEALIQAFLKMLRKSSNE